ncbi:MAG TPA: cryptochrome/photolyase family protein [Phnomibacter sp.]|nr:cryptochrome/photolyase family protein [Phnomibacter sp.]
MMPNQPLHLWPPALALVFPHQLYHHGWPWPAYIPIFLIEEFLFFTQYKFHKKKLILHRASMKAWQAQMQTQGWQVTYVEAADNPLHDIQRWLPHAAQHGVQAIHVIHPCDDWLLQRIIAGCKQHNLQLHLHPNPNFLNTPEQLHVYFAGKKHYHQTDFYIAQRKARNLLLEADGKPVGGKWTYDTENRLKFPRGEAIPKLPSVPHNEILAEAILYVERYFSHHYGSSNGFSFPFTRKEAQKWLSRFLDERFAKFGIYEDAMVAREHYLYHSVLTPMLNIGLLQPDEIVEAALQKAGEKEIPLNSLEGFLRQIVGWREFIRGVYITAGRQQRTTNYWGFTRKIPASFYNATTGITPVDMVIEKVLKTGYNHHIERLMVLGNFFLLCEFHPHEVYRWFMEMYVDAYDWVMVPNVYGMTQFADGGLMTTKPYLSGSNYLLKMGDWPKGEWQQIWDGLFWRFMHVHRAFFTQNPRLGMLVNTFDKMPPEKKEAHLKTAQSFLTQLDNP